MLKCQVIFYPALSIDDVTVAEEGGQASFTITLSQATGVDVTVDYATSDGTGTAGSDYTSTTGTATVTTGATTTTVNVPILADNLVESNETFTLTLSNPGGSSIADNAGSGTITDDDAAGFTVSTMSGNTTESGGTATFTVKLTSQPTADVSIAVSSSDSTEGTVSTAGLTFTSANWNVNQAVTATGVDDATFDRDQIFSIVLGAATSADTDYDGLNPADVSVTNSDNEAAPTVAFNASASSGAESVSAPNFAVSLSVMSGLACDCALHGNRYGHGQWHGLYPG